MSIGDVLWPLLTYWLILFAACYMVVEVGHYHLYDERPKRTGLRVLVGSLILAGMLTWTRSSFDTMFTEQIHLSVLQGIVWFLVFMFVLQFHPWHAAGLGLATMLVVAGVASMAVDSLTTASTRPTPAVARPNQPYRAPLPPSNVGPPVTAGDASKQ